MANVQQKFLPRNPTPAIFPEQTPHIVLEEAWAVILSSRASGASRSGLLLPVLKLMKPVVEHYRFLMIRHQDELWKRHTFESDGSDQN